jgi:magnesium transporter
LNENGMNNKEPDKTFFLSEIIGNKVMLKGKKVGKLGDLVIVESAKLPAVTHVVVKRPFGNPSLLAPWDKVVTFGQDELVIDVEDIKTIEGQPGEQMLLLRDHVLDKKILDLEDTEVEVVYDLKLALKNGKMFVSAVDSSRYGRMRRFGFQKTADHQQNAHGPNENIIPWTYVQPLPPNLTSFKGEVKLKILRENLSEMQPADIADMLEELDRDHRVMVFNQLETERASDTLEEIDPNVQRELVSSLNKDRVAELINQMTPGQAADLFGALSHDETGEILPKIHQDLAVKVRSILEKQEEKAINYATTRFIKVAQDHTADEIQTDYPKLAKGKMVVMYFYVVDENDKLLGVLDIKELLEAPDDALLKDLMVTNIFALHPDSTLKEASLLFARYDFRAIPITDENDKMLGVVPYRDVMRLTHHLVE